MELEQILKSEGMALYRSLMSFALGAAQKVGEGEKISISDAKQIAPYLIERFRTSIELLEISMGYYDPADIAVSHAVNVAIYSLNMAIDMELQPEEVEDTLIAGLLHDIGFGKVPVFHKARNELILQENDPEQVLTFTDKQLATSHPQYGAEAIIPESAQAERIAEIIFQHHERADGSGYPRGLTESEQLLTAQIIAIIDTYELLIHPRPYREALIPHAGIEAIKRGEKGVFSTEMIKKLLKCFSLFPVGHYVKLSDDSIGKVVKTSRDSPLRPEIELIMDSLGNRLDPPRVINLMEHQLLFVTECLPRFEKK